MLTRELLQADPNLAQLTEEQIASIELLSKNDEKAVIAERTGKIYGDIDRDIEAATGLKKPNGVRTFEWLKNDIVPLALSANDLKTQLEAEQEKITGLEQKLADGSADETLKTKLQDQINLVEDLRSQITTKEQEYQQQLTEKEKENKTIRVGNELSNALSGVKFKDESLIPLAVRETYLKTAKEAIMAEYETDFIDDGNGGKRMVFRKDGQIVNNPNNSLNPFTAQELLMDKIKPIVDEGRQQNGAGGQGGNNGNNGNNIVDLSSAKTQVEADEIITSHLLANGLTRDNQEFAEQAQQIRTENKVDGLPIT